MIFFRVCCLGYSQGDWRLFSSLMKVIYFCQNSDFLSHFSDILFNSPPNFLCKINTFTHLRRSSFPFFMPIKHGLSFIINLFTSNLGKFDEVFSQTFHKLFKDLICYQNIWPQWPVSMSSQCPAEQCPTVTRVLWSWSA